MPRDSRSAQHDQTIEDAAHLEWMDLRDQLEDLLDEVTRQRSDASAHEPRPYMEPASRRQDSRHQDTHGNPPPSSDRHSAALKNVRSALDRFDDMQEASPMPPSSRHDIDAAVEQIRSSRGPKRSSRNWNDGVDHESRAHEPRSLGRGTLSRRQMADRRDYSEARRQDEIAYGRDHHRFEQLDTSIGEISDYLSRFDEIISSERLSSSHLSEITVQLEQMTSIVEVLASKVNERGNFDTIERQIATLQTAIEQGAVENSHGLENRLGVLAESFERLSALQAEQGQHSARAYDELLKRTAGEKSDEQFGAIEDGVRNIYDRLDSMSSGNLDANGLQEGLRGVFARIEQLEQNVSAPTPLLQRLTNDITDLSATLKSSKAPVVSSVISSRIDSLNDRISSVENGRESPAEPIDLSAINSQLNETLNAALAPRLAEIETKIGGIANGMKSRAVKLESSPQLEQQIRTLTEKLEQTSTDLAQLREMGGTAPSSASAEMPDLDALADLVAQRTKGAIASVQNSANGNTKEMFGQFESRISGLLDEKASAKPDTDLSSIETGINNVNARLTSLEKSVKTESTAPNVDATPMPSFSKSVQTEESASPARTAARPAHPGLDRSEGLQEFEQKTDRPESGQPHAQRSKSSVHQHLIAELQDTMPKAPSSDGPLNAPAFPEPEDVPASRSTFDNHRAQERKVPIPDVLKSSMGLGLDEDQEFGLDSDFEAQNSIEGSSEARSHIDVPVDLSNAVTPPAPKSSFDMDDDDFEDHQAAGEHQQTSDIENAKVEPRSEFARPSTPLTGTASGSQDADTNAVSRSTFIAAARRAAQANNTEVEEQASTSLFGRAFSRFQKNKNQPDDSKVDAFGAPSPTFDDASAAESPLEQTEEEPRRGRFHQAREAKKQAEAEKRAAAAEQTSEELQDFSYDEEFDITSQNESLLSRYRRPILLGLATIAVSLMALNLVSQRLGEAADQEVLDAAAPLVVEQAQPAEPATTNIDETPVGSIDQLILNDELDSATSPVRMIDPSLFLDTPASLESASLASQLPPAGLSADISIDEAVGPQALRDAAASGDVFAQFEVAAIYADGTSISRDMQKAHDWYLRAAEQGFAPAMYLLANMLENGTGVDKNAEQAAYWYERGAELGNRMSMHNLAAMNASGALGDQNFDMAAKWFERAAALGLTDSQFNLGMLNARGLGVQQDLNTSYKWFSIAALGGDADAVQARTDIARSLDAPTVGQLDSQIQSWSPQELDIKANFAPIGTWASDFNPGTSIDNREIIQRVQAALNKLGYDAGTADGLMGPKTREAIGLFEQATGMATSNDVNPRLLAVLGSQPV